VNKQKTMLPPKWKLAAILSVSFASALMVFIYTPFDIYLNNPAYFIVSWRLMLLPLSGAFILSFLAIACILLLVYHRKLMVGLTLLSLFAVLIIIARFVFQLFSVMFIYMLAAVAVAMVIWVLLILILKENALSVVVLGMWGLLVAAYVQTLLLNSNMVTIMGQQTDYSRLSAGNIINLLIWVAIILIPLCVLIVFKARKKEFRYEKAFVFSLVIISAMQIVGLVSTAISTDLPEGYEENPVYFTYDAAVNFNSDENIVVFVLDTLDVRVTTATFELFPHLWEYLDGFTMYENNTAEFFGTVPSMVSILTGHHPIPWQDGWPYIEQAWDRHIFIDTLRENGWRTNLYLDRNSNFNRYELISDRVDNTMMADNLGINLRPFLSITTRLSLGRFSPYLLKNTWLSSVTPDFGRFFFYIEVENEIAQFIPIVGIESDMRFHRFLRQSEFSADSNESVFTFIFLNSAHANGYIDDPTSHGYHYDEESGEIRQGGSRTDITRASFETLNLYFNKMKEIGVYDNSTIIVMGDHGLRDRMPETTSLFIKPKGSSGELTPDSVTELSHRYFQSSILEAAGLPHMELGISHFDVISGVVPAPPVRRLYVVGTRTAEPSARIYGDYGVWEVIGDANVLENWTFVPVDPMEMFDQDFFNR